MDHGLPSGRRYQGLSKAELLREIDALKEAHSQSEELQRTLQELEIHKAELEMQNSELQDAQQLLELSRDRYAMLYDYAPLGYVSLDTSGIIRDLNFTAADLLGAERQKLKGFPLSHFVPRDQGSDFWDHMRRCRRGDSRIITDLSLQANRREAIPVQLISVPASRSDEDRTFFWTAIIDLTDRRRLEAEREALIREQARRAEAEKANRAKDEFLATLSHELRTPLNVISGWVQLLQMGNLDPGETRRGCTIIQKSVKQQVQIINDLLDMSRIIRGMLHLERGPMDLSGALVEVVGAARVAADEKSIALELKMPQQPCIVLGDPGRLQQVFSNLIQNALKFTPANGRVKVSLECCAPGLDDDPETEMARVTIEDSGVGIRPEFLAFVFERFRQEDSSMTRRHGGLGLGLAIVKHLVGVHGGRVKAESEGEGKGAVFIVELPAIEVRLPEAPVHEHPVYDGQTLENLAILLVEDDEQTRDVLGKALEPFGANVCAVPSASEAFDSLSSRLPSIIVCDIGMPEEDGLSLIRRIRSLPPEAGGLVPAVALTAYVGKAERDRALDAGFDSFLTKPIDPRVLVAEILKLVERSRS